MGSYRPFFPNGWTPPAAGVDDTSCSGRTPDTGLSGVAGDQGAREPAEVLGFSPAIVAASATPDTPDTPDAPPALWPASITSLRTLPCPAWMAPTQWQHLVRSAVALTDAWGERLHALGWSTLDVFGCNPQPWAGRLDRNGLAITIAQTCVVLEVRAVTADSATLIANGRDQLRYRRRPLPQSVPLWVAYAQEGGP